MSTRPLRTGGNGIWPHLRQNHFAMLGLGLILTFGMMAISHPFLMASVWDRTTYHPLVGFDYDVDAHPSPPSWKHLLGTDALGRDVLSQLLFATRTSFGVGLVAGLVASALAITLGILAAHFGGPVDRCLMVVADVFVLMPPHLVLLVIGLLFDLSWIVLGGLFGTLAGLGAYVLVAKAHALSIRLKPYIEAARVAGGSEWHIIVRHYFPNMLPLIFVIMMSVVSQSVLVEALLSFFGRTQIRMSWGTMIWFTQLMFRLSPHGEQWHALLPPALAIILFCGGFLLLGRAMDEVANPRLARR